MQVSSALDGKKAHVVCQGANAVVAAPEVDAALALLPPSPPSPKSSCRDSHNSAASAASSMRSSHADQHDARHMPSADQHA